MNIIRYTNPELSPWPRTDRLSSLRDLLDSACQLTNTSAGRSQSWTPVLDVFEDEEKVTVQVELAGMKKEDFDLSLQDGVLTISGERQLKRENREGESFRSERFFGSFSRGITLPSSVKSDAVKASYQDGILTITLPKAEEAKPKRIQVSLD